MLGVATVVYVDVSVSLVALLISFCSVVFAVCCLDDYPNVVTAL